jgi:uncharacterized protein YdbL (DUF1318 family)
MARLNPLRLPTLDGRASPRAFGAGRSIESFGGGAGVEAYGGGRNVESFGAYKPDMAGPEALVQLGQLGAQIADTVLRVNRQDDIIEANGKVNQFRLDRTQWLNGLKEHAPENPVDFTKSAMDEYDTWQKQQVDGLSGVQREIVETRLSELKVSLYNEADGFEQQSRTRYRVGKVKGDVEAALNVVATRPDMYGAVLQDQLDAIEASGLPATAKGELTATTRAAVAQAHWQGMLGQDLDGTVAALKQDGDIPDLEYSDRLRLVSAGEVDIRARDAEARQRQAQAEARARAAQQDRLEGLRFQVGNAVDALQAGLPVAGLGDLRKAVLAEGERGANLQQALTGAVATAEYASQFALLPVEDQAAQLEALRSTPQDPSNPVPMMQLQAASKVLQATVSAVKDGRGLERAAQLGIVDLEPVDFTDPASIAGRVSASRMASAHMGVPTEMFTPEERAGVASRLAAMPGEERAAYLAKLQEASGEEYPDVIRELSRKGGLDRGSKYLAVLSGRPETAAVANAIGEAAETDDKDLKVNLARQGVSQGDLDTAVSTRLDAWSATVGGSYRQGSGAGGAQAMLTDVTDMVTKSALVLMRTMPMEQAVQQAADAIINDRYEFRDTYRIPRPARGGDEFVKDVDRKIETRVRNLTSEMLDPRGSLEGVSEQARRAAYLQNVRTYGTWGNLPDESGLFLMDEQGNAVTSGGKPIIVPFKRGD